MHKESSSKRLDRLTLTIESSVNSKKNIKDFSCSECGEYFGTSDEQNYHIDEYHGGNGVIVTEAKEDKLSEKEIDINICELCDKVFHSRVVVE